MLQVGQNIPDSLAPDQFGKERRLYGLLGAKGGVIYFYPKDNTPGCTLEAQDFQAHGGDFQAMGYAIVGISKDSVPSHEKFCAKYQLGFTLLSDQDGRLCEGFGVWQEKKNYGKTYMGIVRATFVVDAHGLIQQVYPKVKTKGHAEQVLQDLRRRTTE
ncbi:MAG: peroxiredoxin [Magnetococcales bacterium]|nr:peroxiredoxin [Magnetococcales bacterium]MBF0321662.1 peroxiredoxin [Magnetococcales bacterium]